MKKYIKTQLETKPFGGTIGITIIIIVTILIIIL